jgi:hypothetical protein
MTRPGRTARIASTGSPTGKLADFTSIIPRY